MKRQNFRNKRGFTIVAVALSILAMIGSVGLAVDIGRAYIAKNETQLYTDSAALAATLELDGTMEGISRALAQVSANKNKWNLATSVFSSTTVSFGRTPNGPWEPMPINPDGVKYTRVNAQVPLPLFFIPIVTGGWQPPPPPMAFLMLASTMDVRATSAGGQELKTYFTEGLFPFSPYAHDLVTAPHYGLTPGQLYTLRWASNPRVNQNTCPGDNVQYMIDRAGAGGGSERGYIEETSAAIIRATIEGDYQTVKREIGDTVNMTGGSKQTELDALKARVGQDTDSASPNWIAYDSSNRGNGRRLVAVPINNGYPEYRIVQIGAFLLLPVSTYEQGGNEAWCAEYVGAYVQGSKHKGVEETGAWAARLIR